MLTLPPSVRVYLASSAVDMRRGHDGLMSIVLNDWKMDPYAGHLFVFLGKRLDRVKLLYFDRGGFMLAYKRLEKGRFKLPTMNPGKKSVEIESVELAMLLEGIDFSRVRQPARWNPPSLACSASIERRIEKHVNV